MSNEHDLFELPETRGRGPGELIVARPPTRPHEVIATLGPSGTSSEAAGRHLLDAIGLSEGAATGLALHPSYEEASAAVLSGRAGRLLVANAYHGINRFYMDTRITLERVFVLDTPRYGLAAQESRPLPLTCDVVTHPAPSDLIQQLIPGGYRVSEVSFVASTSAAAASVASGEFHLALTTEPAARLHGLRFVSGTRPIKMLWSVFIRQWERARPAGQANDLL